MTEATPAIGTGLLPPTLPRVPAPSTARAASPVAGHGSDGRTPGRCTDVDIPLLNTGAGVGPNHRSPASATRTTTTTPTTSNLRRATFRALMCSSSSEVFGICSPRARSRASLVEACRRWRRVASELLLEG